MHHILLIIPIFLNCCRFFLWKPESESEFRVSPMSTTVAETPTRALSGATAACEPDPESATTKSKQRTGKIWWEFGRSCFRQESLMGSSNSADLTVVPLSGFWVWGCFVRRIHAPRSSDWKKWGRTGIIVISTKVSGWMAGSCSGKTKTLITIPDLAVPFLENFAITVPGGNSIALGRIFKPLFRLLFGPSFAL